MCFFNFFFLSLILTGIAFKIMHAYPDLLNFGNENGPTPLHILASKPNAFKSCSRLGLIDRIIYYCKHIDLIKISYLLYTTLCNELVFNLLNGGSKCQYH